MAELYPDNEGGTLAPDLDQEFQAIVQQEASRVDESLGLRPFTPGEHHSDVGPAIIYGCFPVNSDNDSDGVYGDFATI